MFDRDAVELMTQSKFIQGLDLSMFAEQDIINVVLQRSEVLYDLENPDHVIRQWTKGNDGAMRDLVSQKGHELVRRAIAVLYREFLAMKPTLDGLQISRIADIGCGYAFFDFFAARDYQAQLVLVDIETNDKRYFGFEDTAAAYTSLDVAKQFLKANGIPDASVETVNPLCQDLSSVEPVDLAISFLSCGFHYPLSKYDWYWSKSVVPGGHIMLDVRTATFDAQMADMAAYGRSKPLWSGQKWQRMVIEKAAA